MDLQKSCTQLNKSLNARRHFGQGMTEYIIIVGVIAVAAIGAFGFFGDTVEHQIAGMAAELSGNDGSAEQTAAGASATAAAGTAGTVNNLGSYHNNGTNQ